MGKFNLSINFFGDFDFGQNLIRLRITLFTYKVIVSNKVICLIRAVIYFYEANEASIFSIT